MLALGIICNILICILCFVFGMGLGVKCHKDCVNGNHLWGKWREAVDLRRGTILIRTCSACGTMQTKNIEEQE